MARKESMNLRTLDFSKARCLLPFLLKCFVLASFAVISIVTFFYVQYFHFKPIYALSYMRGFNYQNDALKRNVKTKKIVIIGGSYMTFALNPDIIHEKTGMPTYILGVHSGMGMKPVIDLVKNYVQADDTLLFSFRSYQGDYYGMELMYLTFENDFDLFKTMFKYNPPAFISSIGNAIYVKAYNLAHDTIRDFFRKNNTLTTQANVYDARSFDPQTGKIIYDRPNVDAEAEADLALHKSYKYEWDISNCAGQIKELNNYCVAHGVRFLLAYGPIYSGSIDDANDEGVLAYQEQLEKSLGISFINTISESLVPKEYCFNGARHLNNAGTNYYSTLLGDRLKEFIVQ